MTRDVRTLSLYLALGGLGYVLAGLGAILPELRLERDLSRGEAALYPSGFALGLVVIGIVGVPVARRLGRVALPAAVVALAGGTAVLTLNSDRLVAGLGAIVLGLGGAGLVQLVPATLRTLHGDDGAVALGEANAVASSAAVLAPLLVGAALAAGIGWQVGFLAMPVTLAVAALAVLARAGRDPVPLHQDLDPRAAAGGRAPPEFWGWWLTIVLAVGVEFCLLFWAADFLRSETGLPADVATSASVAFVLGMALGRAVVSAALRLFDGDTIRLLTAAALVAAVGFGLFWATAQPLVALGGLVLTGAGVALLYPLTLAAALAAWPSDPVRAASRCALASGLAVGSAPVVLGALADVAGLRSAFLVAPALLALLLHRLVRRVAVA